MENILKGIDQKKRESCHSIERKGENNGNQKIHPYFKLDRLCILLRRIVDEEESTQQINLH